jgi:CBS domain-containing protein
MTKQRIGAVPVLEGGRLVGILTERDLMTRVVAVGKGSATDSVGEEEIQLRDTCIRYIPPPPSRD